MNTNFHIDIEDGDACDMTQDSFEMEVYQQTQYSSLDHSDPQNQLLTALFDNDYPRFEELVTHDAVDLEYTYKQPDEKKCLEFAVCEPNKQEYVKLLLQHKVEVNNVNKFKGLAPIHFAAMNGNIEALKVLLEDDRIDVNNTDRDNNTALFMAIETMNYLEADIRTTYEDIIELLLKAGCNANSRNLWGKSPIYIAAKQGLKIVVQMIIDHVEEPMDILLEPVNSESILQATVRGMGYYCKSPKEDFNWCIDLFLEKYKINVNHPDEYKNTALHYAGRNGDDEIVLKLLRHGACVSSRNKFNIPPLAEIDIKTLETYLDECITTDDIQNYKPNDNSYEIYMIYSFLAHTNNSIEYENCKVPLIKEIKELDATLAPETDGLLYMAQNEELHPLLKHPVISSFLSLKWQRISCLAYANMTFYSLLWLCLILYIILGYGVEKKQSNSIEALNIVTYIGVIIGLILLIIREFFQLLLSPVRYLQGCDNWIEIVLISIITWIVSHDSEHVSIKQQLSAVAILISSTELILLIGQFPVSSTNILMLKTVSWNFLKFLLWYCILIIAFALSFYTLFRQVEEDQTPPPTNLNRTDEYEGEEFFNDPFRALFKTIVMLTGEFDAGSIQFNTFPITSHIIFILFVFMIPIVLFNLLNGLAVSDTQKIRADAELVGLISRVKLISYFESLLLGNAKACNEPTKCWSWLTTHLQNMNTCILNLKTICVKPLAKRICLFPHFLPGYKIIVRPNQDNQIWIPCCRSYRKYCRHSMCKTTGGEGCFGRCKIYKLDAKIVQNAKIVINKKTKITEFDEIKASLLKCETKIDSLEDIKAILLKYESKIETLDEIKARLLVNETKMENLTEIKTTLSKYEAKMKNLDKVEASLLKNEANIKKLETKVESLDTTLNKVLQTLERMSSKQH